MQKNTWAGKYSEVPAVRWILAGLIAITLYFQTNLNDPFNSPKLWILLIISAWLTGYIFKAKDLFFTNEVLKHTFYLALAFIFVALVISLVSDSKFVAILGETQRRNGFLTYLSLAIFFLASSLYIRLFNIKRFFSVTYFIAITTAVYAFMQASGQDFVNWNNPYNAIIGTSGNPNFAAAVMAILGVITFTSIFINGFSVYYKIFGSIITLSLLGLILQSNARQGLLSYFLGVGLFIIVLLLGKNRKIGIGAAAAGIIIFIYALLGMLQYGPLERFLYKPSVSVRGYYWRAGIEMLKDNFFTGVGMDRYGAYFKEYREVGYPLSYGFDITSTNAHNTFIQFFATGGVFLGGIYLLLNGYILRRAFIGLKNSTGDNRLLFAGVFSAWMAFHAQSLVSIDNIGISIWGWVLGGSIVGLSISATSSESNERNQFAERKNAINLNRVLISSMATSLAIFLVTFLYRAEINTYNSRVVFNIEDQQMRSQFMELQYKAINSPLIDPSYALNCAIALVQAGFSDEGLKVAMRIYKNDQRNLDALNGLALISEGLNQIPEAINYRLKMTVLDPWNAVNYLELGRHYKERGNINQSSAMLEKILSFSTGPIGSPLAEQAKLDLTE